MNMHSRLKAKKLFPINSDWYYLLADIFKSYQEDFIKELDTRFYINFLASLDHLMSLTLAYEYGKRDSGFNDAVAVLLLFDQQLKRAVEEDVHESSWVHFLQHMKGQIYFQMASLLMKLSEKNEGNRKEAYRFSSALLLVGYTFKPVNLLREIWFGKMEDDQMLFSNFFQEGALRTSYTSHMIRFLCGEDGCKWVQEIKYNVCLPQLKEKIYQRLFGVITEEKLSSSYFIQDPTFVQGCLEFPSNKALLKHNLSTNKLCCDSLQKLVWLQLHQEVHSSKECRLSEVFKGLQYSHEDLTTGSAESLCVLDFEAYLQATIYQAKNIECKVTMNKERYQHSPLCLPPDVSDPLCSQQQAKWWYGAYSLFSCSISENLCEHRIILQHGLEVIRGVGNHGLEVQLVVHLAHYFANKSNNLSKKGLDTTERKTASADIKALEARATHYWKIAIGLLDKLLSGQTFRVPRDQMFAGGKQKLCHAEIQSLKEEGKLYLAVTLKNSKNCEYRTKEYSTITLHEKFCNTSTSSSSLVVYNSKDQYSSTERHQVQDIRLRKTERRTNTRRKGRSVKDEPRKKLNSSADNYRTPPVRSSSTLPRNGIKRKSFSNSNSSESKQMPRVISPTEDKREKCNWSKDMQKKKQNMLHSKFSSNNTIPKNAAVLKYSTKQGHKANVLTINNPSLDGILESSNIAVIGTCQDLEKPFLRLTGAVDPSKIRPEDVLIESFKLVEDSYSKSQEYNFACEQLKSIRQDLVVQHIRNRFTVYVYETHARIALENGDKTEFNQCQSQLKSLYKETGIGNKLEFTGYHILYNLFTEDNVELKNILSELSDEDKTNEVVSHALKLTMAVSLNNYHKIFKLYLSAPMMSGFVINWFLDRIRKSALKACIKSYRPNLPVSFFKKELAFSSSEELTKFLAEEKLVYVDALTIDCKESYAILSGQTIDG